MIRALIVDDHALFRRGVAGALTEAGIVVVGEAADGAEAVGLARSVSPDIILMDLHMPGVDGVAATRALVPDYLVLILTVSDRDNDLKRAIEAGAHGYVLKHAPPELLVQAVRDVAAGRGYLSPEMSSAAMRAARRQGGGTDDPLGPLSDREREVLSGIVGGLSNGAIAAELGISEHTVKTYVGRIYEKLGVSTRAQAAAIATRHEHG